MTGGVGSVPALRAELEELEHKLIDLLPVVRENVYHPDFQGSFSIKYVLAHRDRQCLFPTLYLHSE